MLIRIGNHGATREPIWLPVAALTSTHTWVLGSTGSGKSRLLRPLIEGTINLGYPTVVVDAKGDLIADIAGFCAANQIGPDRLVILDPADSTFCPGFDPLELGALEPYARATVLTQALMKVFGEAGEMRPWLMDYARHGLAALAYSKLSLLDLEPFLRDQGFRDVVVERCTDRRIQEFWGHVDGLSPSDREARISAALTRVSLLLSAGEGVRRLFASPMRFDMQKVIDNNGVLLVNASESAGIDQSAASLLGISVVQRLLEVCSLRKRGTRVPVFLAIDELQEIASEDVVRSLAKARGWGLHLIGAHQDLDQVRQVPGLYSSLSSNAQNRFFFAGSSRDHEDLVPELFSGYWPDREIVQEIYTESPWPEQRWEDKVTTNVGRSVAHHPEIERIAYHPEVTSYHESTGEGDSSAFGVNQAVSFDGEDFTRRVGSSHSSGSSSTRGSGTAKMPAYEAASITPAYDVETDSYSETHSRELVTYYRTKRQLSSRQLETLEDIKERVRGWLVTQGARSCFVKLGTTSPPFPLVVKFVPDRPVSERTLALYRRLVLRNYPTRETVDEALRDRPRLLIEAYGAEHTATQTLDQATPKANGARAPRTAQGLGRRY